MRKSAWKRAQTIAFAVASAFALGNTPAHAAPAPAPPAIVVSDAWSRPAIETGVVYARITNAGPHADRLDGARSPVARALELHRSMEMNDMATMQPVRFMAVAAHGVLVLQPGGGHVMAIGLRRVLHANDTFPVQLHFARAGWIAVVVHVRPV